MALSKEILDKINEWTKSPYDEVCINEIKTLVKDNNEKELTERFGAELDFGTGGIRGIIGYGTNRMNIYIIAKCTQGLANYVLKNKFKNPSAVIAYDSRKYSFEFAKKTAEVFASNGIKTYIFKELRPTPELSFAIRYLKCSTGVVITASHNPKEYNGYKAYWDDGAQLIYPHDKNVIDEVRQVKTMSQVKNKDFETLLKDNMIEWASDDIDDVFINEIIKLSINKSVLKNCDIKIVYTPLHGTGGTLIPKAVKKIGLPDLIFVDEQMKPDPNFSTVVYPNPEEKEALKLAIKKAEEYKADLVIATDPDADRMGVAVKDKNNNYIILNGNQIGVILEYYILSQLNLKKALPENGAVVKTIVTTNLQNIIGEDFGLKVFDVLTGFKYIGGKIRQFEIDNNYKYIYGDEESFGYLTGSHARDKDSIASTLMFAECAAFLKKENKTILDYLEEIYKKYGFYKEALVTKGVKGLDGIKVINNIMEHFRKNQINKIGGIEIKKIIDYQNDKVPDCKDSPYYLPQSNVIQYFLTDGSVITLRPSGTEPKIKFYFSTKAGNENEANIKLDIFVMDFIGQVDLIVNKNS